VVCRGAWGGTRTCLPPSAGLVAAAHSLSAGATGLDVAGTGTLEAVQSHDAAQRWEREQAANFAGFAQRGQPHARVERHVESRCYGSTTHASSVAGAVSCTRRLLSRPATWANRARLASTVETHERHRCVLASEQHALPPPLIAASALPPGNLCHGHRVDSHAGPSCTKLARASHAWDCAGRGGAVRQIGPNAAEDGWLGASRLRAPDDRRDSIT
jgi:hypothetical protein